MTYNEIKTAYQNEDFEFGLATQAQVEKVQSAQGTMFVVFDWWANGRRINPKRFWTEREANEYAANSSNRGYQK